MKRELKFRAWHRPSRRMFDVVELSTFGATKLSSSRKTKGICIQCHDICFSPFVRESDCELMQYTGIKDKNGKDIYEGDILLMPREATMSHPTGEDECCRVDMLGGAFGYWSEGSFESFLSWYGETEVLDDVVMIGNIWKTPEFVII